MQDLNSNYKAMPNKDGYCIWMDAGLVAYKLCDREFKCEECPLDEELRKKSGSTDMPSLASLQIANVERLNEKTQTPQEYFERRLDDFFQPLLSTHLPNDREYHKCHMWVRSDSSSASTTGIDHIGAYFLQPIVSAVLPQIPSRVERKSPCAWLVLQEGTIALRSAVSGIATEANNDLLEHPYLLLDDPYNSGWILRITKPEGTKPRNELFTSDEFTPIFHKEVSAIKDRFAAAFRRVQPSVGSTLFDGGEPIKSIQEILGYKKYFEIMSKLFSKM